MDFNFDPKSYAGLDKLGRISLSESFHMREFLYSEIAIHYGKRNVPDNVEAAVCAGRMLCGRLLEPLQSAFGRIHVRSGYRSREVNQAGVDRHSCAADNDGHHTWDYPTKSGHGLGATACISIPWVSKKVLSGEADEMAIAWWIVDHLPEWSALEFFATKLEDGSDELAFNIAWHEKPMRSISTWRGGPRNRSKLIPSPDHRQRLWAPLVRAQET